MHSGQHLGSVAGNGPEQGCQVIVYHKPHAEMHSTIQVYLLPQPTNDTSFS